MRPVSTTSAADSRNAPTASAIVTPVVAAIRAAPGVDHARTTGTRVRQLSQALPSALAMQTANTQLAVCSAMAPTAVAATAVAADRTSAMVEPWPISAATSAAEICEARMGEAPAPGGAGHLLAVPGANFKGAGKWQARAGRQARPNRVGAACWSGERGWRRVQGGGEDPPPVSPGPREEERAGRTDLEVIRRSAASGSDCGGAREEEARRRFCT